MGATKDIGLTFGVSMGEDGSPDSLDIIKGELQTIVDTLNKTPFKIAFTVDESSLDSIKNQISSIASSLNVNVVQSVETKALEISNTSGSQSVSEENKKVAESAKEAAAAQKELNSAEQAGTEIKKRSASASQAESNAEKERAISLRQFLALYKNLQTLEVNNKAMVGIEQYDNVAGYANSFSVYYDELKNETADLDNIINRMGEDFVENFDKATIAAKQLEAAIPGQSAGIKYESVLNKINEINGLLGSKSGKELAINDSALWNRLKGYVDDLNKSIDRTQKSFKEFGVEGAEDISKISEVIRDANIDIANAKAQIKKTTTEVDPYSIIAGQVDKMGKVMKTARGLNLESTQEYNAVKSSMETLNTLIDRNTGSLKEFATEAVGSGTRMSNAMESASRVMSNLNNIINQTDKETKSSGIALDTFIAKINKMDKAVNGKTANKIGLSADTNSPTFNQAYADVIKYIDAFKRIQDEAEKTGKSVESILNSGFISDMDASAINQAAVAYQKLQTVLGNANKSANAFNTSEKERQQLLSKSYGLLNQTQQALKNWNKAATGKSQYSYNNIKEYNAALNNLITKFKNGAISTEDFSNQLTTINEKYKADAAIIKQCGEATTSFGSSLARVAKNFSMWFSLSAIIMRVYRNIREMVTASIELDDAMTQLKIVTNETDDVYKSFGNTLADMAKRTAISITDLTTSATTYARLGYGLKDAAKIAEYTAKLQNVGDIGVEDAQDAITAILKAYDDIDVNNIEEVMNKLVVTGNGFPISVSQIAEGMNNASSALAAAGNTFDQSVALLTAANTTIQDAAKSSTALRTIAARIRKTDSELEELGEAMTSSKYDDLIKGLTGLEIALVDINGEYRSTYDILADIASKWDSLSSMEQAALADAIAGTRQQAAFFSIIEQFQEASGSMEAMADSAGALDDAYATYLDSTTAHINQFKASFQELSATIMSSELLSTIVDIGKSFVELTNAVAKAKLGLVAIGGAIGVGLWVKHAKTIAAETIQVKSLTSQLMIEKKVTSDLAISIQALNKSQLEKLKTDLASKLAVSSLSDEEKEKILNDIALIASEEALEGENVRLAASFKAVSASIPVWGVVLLSLGLLITAIGSAAKASEELKSRFKESTEQLSDEISVIDDFKDRIAAVAESGKSEIERLEDYNKIRQEINDGYGSSISYIENETKALAVLNTELDNQAKKRRELYLLENRDAYNEAKSKAKDFNTYNSWTDRAKDLIDGTKESDPRILQKYNLIAGYGNFKTKNISDDIMSMFVLDDKKRLTIGKDAKNEKELFTILEDAYIQLGHIADARKRTGTNLTKEEEALFKAVERNYEDLKEHLGEDGIDFDKIYSYASQVVDSLVDTIPQGTMSLEEWRQALIISANEDEYVIEKINEMIDSLSELNDSTETDGLEKINKLLETLESRLDQVSNKIKTASDYFDDLAKVFKTNNDADKFFSADEMIDMLDKYPELADNILVTAYGYKFETAALEELRKAKVDEQKEALKAQIAEAKGIKENAEKEIQMYAAKVKGISTLAEAEVALAEVEDHLNNGGFKKGGYIANQLEEKRKVLKGAIDAWNRIADANKTIDTVTMQYTILGNVFDDLKDKTNDATTALNNEKSALRDLGDDIKDAQKAIEDLIKLTMDMIKKEKSLQKDALKEQLDGFKKLIEKRKNLIDLEKDQYKFEANLKEQNKDLLKIQQELDALSVEGANYSLEDLKRKAELEEQLADQQTKRNDFLYDHEVDVRKQALDEEEKSFEEQINTQIKAIEDYLDHEGRIRQDAVDLINSQTQEFYNRLIDYTMNYTDKSRYEVDKLWNDAYEALRKYGNGVIDVDATLAFLIGRIAQIENEINALEEKINSAKSAASQFTDGFEEGLVDVGKVIADDIEAAHELEEAVANAQNTTSAHSYWHVPSMAEMMSKVSPRTPSNISTPLQYSSKIAENLQKVKAGTMPATELFKFHDGGLVPHQGIRKNSEVFAKLLAGEVVVTQDQATNFFKNTLPKLTSASITNNNSNPTISIGDINISGNADAATVTQLKEAQKEIVNNVFKTINSQKNVFNGGKIK